MQNRKNDHRPVKKRVQSTPFCPCILCVPCFGGWRHRRLLLQSGKNSGPHQLVRYIWSWYMKYVYLNCELGRFTHDPRRSSEKGLKNLGLSGGSNPDLCHALAVLHQLMEVVVIHVFLVSTSYIYVCSSSVVVIFLIFSLGLSAPWTNGTTASVSNGNKETHNSSSSPKWIGARGKRPCLSGRRCQTRVLHESQKLAHYQQHASDISHTLERSMAEWLYCEQTRTKIL